MTVEAPANAGATAKPPPSIRRCLPVLGLAVALGATLGVVPVAAQEPDPIPAGVAPPFGPYAPGVDVVHYDVEIALEYAMPFIESVVDVKVAVVANRPVLPLDLSGLEVTEVRVDGTATGFEHTRGVLRVPLSSSVAGDTVVVRVAYRGVPDDGLILRDNVHGDPSAFVDNWPNRTRFWLPSVDHPADKATVRYTVHAPTQWRVIANGALVGGEPTATRDGRIGEAADRRTWVWEVGVPISTYNMVIGATNFAVDTLGVAACGQAPATWRRDGCVSVELWSYPRDRERARPSFRRAVQMVDHFTDLIGPYPFEKLAHVQSATRFGGMENASAIFYSEQAMASGRDIEGTVSHETAHQWFGDAVTEATWHHLWLSEGFATYFGAQFFEAADGVEAFRERMEQSRRRVVASADANTPIYDPGESDLFALLNDNNYPKGGWVLHMLRGIVGDDAFFAGIRSYYRDYLHSVATTEDFQRVMEEASGRDLDWFFAQWIYRPGFPTFDVDWTWIADEGGGGAVEVTLRQVQPEEWPTFRVPLEIEIVSEGSTLRRDVELTRRVESVRIEGLARRPIRIVIDPDGWVLGGDPPR